MHSSDSAAATGPWADPAVLLAVTGRLCDALHRCEDPAAAVAHIEAARHALLGPGLLTVNVDATRPHGPPGEILLVRAWSSNPDAYPVGGSKRKLRTPWLEHLLVRGEVFVGDGEASLAAVFDDVALITSLGLRSVVNVPLMDGGRCRATFNVLGTRRNWQAQEIAAVRLLALVARPYGLRLAAALGLAQSEGAVRGA